MLRSTRIHCNQHNNRRLETSFLIGSIHLHLTMKRKTSRASQNIKMNTTFNSHYINACTYFIIIILVIGQAFQDFWCASIPKKKTNLIAIWMMLLLMDVNRNNKQHREQNVCNPDCTNCLKTDRVLSISTKWLKFARVFFFCIVYTPFTRHDGQCWLLLLLLSHII